jgi:hypothetical protein
MAAIDEGEFERMSREHYDCHTEAAVPSDLKLILYAAIYEGDRPTNRVIDIKKPWEVRIWWCLRGGLRTSLCGYWCPSVHFESIGRAPEFDYMHKHVEFDCNHGCWKVVIPGSELHVDPSACSSPYEVAVTVTYLNKCEKPGPIAGFCVLKPVQFYEG